LNENYSSKYEFEAGAMDGTVYTLTDSVLHSMFNDNLFPPCLVEKLE
jgi:hypothetical protein